MISVRPLACPNKVARGLVAVVARPRTALGPSLREVSGPCSPPTPKRTPSLSFAGRHSPQLLRPCCTAGEASPASGGEGSPAAGQPSEPKFGISAGRLAPLVPVAVLALAFILQKAAQAWPRVRGCLAFFSFAGYGVLRAPCN